MSGILSLRRASARFVTLPILVVFLGLAFAPSFAKAAGGDLVSVQTLLANFDSDSPNSPPNLTLPGGPTGDYLTLATASGTVRVVPSYDGLTRPVEVRQLNVTGSVALNAYPGPTPQPAEKVNVTWRSIAKDDEAIILMSFAVRASNGATLASVEYLHQGGLSYNGALLPVTQPNKRAQLFSIDVDLVAHTTSLSVDGASVAGFQNVPFAQAGNDVGYFTCFGDGNHPQTMYVDDIAMTATYRLPNATPVVVAPRAVDGEEGGILIFDVTASDPDGDPVTLTADLSSLPAGHSATFTTSADGSAGTFQWPMQRGEAGAYDVVFTATNSLTASATTRVNVAFAGTTVTGILTWTPTVVGTYTVTFTATNNLGETGSASTTFDVTASSATTAPLGAAPLSGRGGVALSPDREMKGPVVSVVGLQTTSPGKTTTTSATATDTGTAALAAALRGVSKAGAAAQGVVSFTADLTNLPAGNDAVFVVDQEPVVTAPASRTVDSGTALSFSVGCSDPDGDTILGLDADLSALPSGNTAAFTTGEPFTSGTFAWTPRASDAGTYSVTFTGRNALVGSATTSITVRAVAEARIYLAGQRKIRLASNKPFGCVQIEPVNESFSLLDIDLTSIKMISNGTGTVSEITANTTKSAVIGDRDGNQIEDIQVCFNKSDFRSLFSLLRGNVSVPVLVRGSLVTGGFFQGTVTLDIQAGNGTLQTALAPNPLNPSGTLAFITRTAGPVRVSLFDLNGRLVRTLWRKDAAPAGAYKVPVEARGDDGRSLPSGVYFYRIESRDGTDTGRFTVLK